MVLLARTQHPDTLRSKKYTEVPVWHQPCRWWACRSQWCCFPGRTWSSPCTPPRQSALRCTRSQTRPVSDTSHQLRDQRTGISKMQESFFSFFNRRVLATVVIVYSLGNTLLTSCIKVFFVSCCNYKIILQCFCVLFLWSCSQFHSAYNKLFTSLGSLFYNIKGDFKWLFWHRLREKDPLLGPNLDTFPTWLPE